MRYENGAFGENAAGFRTESNQSDGHAFFSIKPFERKGVDPTLHEMNQIPVWELAPKFLSRAKDACVLEIDRQRAESVDPNSARPEFGDPVKMLEKRLEAINQRIEREGAGKKYASH